MNADYNIVFMGTPGFAVPTLMSLHNIGHKILQVVTQPDRPKGRGRNVFPTPVKVAATQLGYPIIQPESLRTDEFTQTIRRLQPDLFVVVAFGHILRKELIQIPRLGAINLHASLLPKYRGPAPIQWAIINGETKTGVTTIMMDAGMDTGDILMTETTDIAPTDTADILHDRLATLGAGLLIKTLQHLSEDRLIPLAQNQKHATYAPMLKKEDGRIRWDGSAESIFAFIRGMTPWPGAFTYHNEQRFKIYRSEALDVETDAEPGVVMKSFADELRVATGKGTLSILEIQGPSGKRLPIDAFLRGYSIQPGERLN